MTNTMYIGPSIRGVVKHGAAFSGGLPARVQKLADAKPIINNLIVPVSDLADAIKRSNEEGTAVAVAYDRISELTETEIKKIMEGV